MENYQFFTLIAMLAAGFSWMIMWLRSIDHRLNDLETRVTVIETILAMMGAPIRSVQNKERTNP
jgi:hypothetical protein